MRDAVHYLCNKKTSKKVERSNEAAGAADIRRERIRLWHEPMLHMSQFTHEPMLHLMQFAPEPEPDSAG